MQLARVDFPQPEGPAISTFSPRRRVRFMPMTVGSDWELY